MFETIFVPELRSILAGTLASAIRDLIVCMHVYLRRCPADAIRFTPLSFIRLHGPVVAIPNLAPLWAKGERAYYV